jgi:hypothetical protein
MRGVSGLAEWLLASEKDSARRHVINPSGIKSHNG